MPMPGHLWLEGQKTGKIKGGCTQKGREDSIFVLAFSHNITSPRDPASGLPTGKRMHKPLTVTKEVDKATPLLYNVMVNNENVKKLEIKFFQTQKTGGEKHYYTIELVNANIADMKTYYALTSDPANARLPHLEDISFTYQKILWTYVDGGITAEDDWEVPVT